MKLPQGWLVAALCLLLAGITWLVFGQTLGFDFVNFDDADYVLKNPHVTDGLTSSGIVWAFTHVHAGNWHPLTWISHMLDCQFFGLNPWGHHLTNVLLHIATVVGLFLVLWRMTEALWRSAFAAAIFAIHPLRLESVAWIAERKDVLSGLFFVLTVAAYARYARATSIARYLLVLVLFALGLMCKPMLVTLPFVLLLLDYWPLNRFSNEPGNLRRLLLEKLPLALLSLAASLITILAQTITISPLAIVPLGARIANASTSVLIYLRQMFWPTDLAVFYPFSAHSISSVIVSLAILLAISAAVFFLRRRRYLVTGWLWYLIMLAPVIGIIQVGQQAHADRYTYLPQIGLYLAIAWAFGDLAARSQPLRFFLSAVATIAIAGLLISARAEAAHWRNGESLWIRALACTPDNAVTRRNLAHAYYEKGRIDEALVQYQRSLELDPSQAMVYSNRGAMFLETGRLGEAVRDFERALTIDPKYADAYSNLGLAAYEENHPQESINYLQKALAINPNLPDAHYNLGNTFLSIGRPPDAVEQYKKALELDPRDERALNNLAWILATAPNDELRNGARAVELAARADALTRRENPVIHATLAAAYAEAGRFEEALTTARSAADLASTQGNAALAESIRTQAESYAARVPFRDRRNPTSR